jgi:hypothetical protein
LATASPAQTPPKVHRPQAKPINVPVKPADSLKMRQHPHAPAVYRPQPIPKVLQTKNSRTANAAPQGVPQAKRVRSFPNAAGAHNAFKPVVQGYFLLQREGVFLGQEARQTPTGKSYLAEEGGRANVTVSFRQNIRVSNDGKMAIESGNGVRDRQAKTFYAHPTVVTTANQSLRNIGSPIRLATNDRITIQVPNISRTQFYNLVLVYPVDLITKRIGHNVQIPQRCNEAGPYIGNTKSDDELKPRLNIRDSFNPPRHKMHHGITDRLAALLPLYMKRELIRQPLGFGNAFSKLWSSDPSSDIHAIESIGIGEFYDIAERRGKGSAERGVNEIVRDYVKDFLEVGGSASILEELGLNEYIDPSVGDLLSIRSLGMPRNSKSGDWYVMDNVSGKELRNPFPYHFATVIAKSGADYITMENYARREEEGDKLHDLSKQDPRYYFKMFGPREQSFHAEQRKDYANPMTLRFSSGRGPRDFGEGIDGMAIAHYNQGLDSLHGRLVERRIKREQQRYQDALSKSLKKPVGPPINAGGLGNRFISNDML